MSKSATRKCHRPRTGKHNVCVRSHRQPGRGEGGRESVIRIDQDVPDCRGQRERPQSTGDAWGVGSRNRHHTARKFDRRAELNIPGKIVAWALVVNAVPCMARTERVNQDHITRADTSGSRPVVGVEVIKIRNGRVDNQVRVVPDQRVYRRVDDIAILTAHDMIHGRAAIDRSIAIECGVAACHRAREAVLVVEGIKEDTRPCDVANRKNTSIERARVLANHEEGR